MRNVLLRMQTDANQGGIEKLSICETHPSYKCQRCGIAADDLSPRLCRPFAPHGGIHGERLDQRGLRYHSPSLCISVRRVHDIFAIGGATATWYLVSLVVSQLIFHAPELDLMTSQHGSTCLPSLC